MTLDDFKDQYISKCEPSHVKMLVELAWKKCEEYYKGQNRKLEIKFNDALKKIDELLKDKYDSSRKGN